MEWFRWYHGTVNDPKFTIVARMANQPKIAVLAVWSAILEHASQDENRGSIEGFDIEVTAVGLDMDMDAVVTICHALSQRKMIDEKQVLNWTKRQPKREDDTAAERQRNKRDRDKLQLQLVELQKKLDDALNGHAMSRNVTQCHAREIEREEEIERKKEKAAAGITSEGSLEGGETAGEGEPQEPLPSEDDKIGDPPKRMAISEAQELVQTCLGRLQLTGTQVPTIRYMCDNFTPDAISEAFRAAGSKNITELGWVVARLEGRSRASPVPTADRSEERLMQWAGNDWLRLQIAYGLQALLHQPLKKPKEFDIAKNAEIWWRALRKICPIEEVDGSRVKAGFDKLFPLVVDWWPAPKQLIDLLPARPRREALPLPKPTDAQYEEGARRLRELSERLK